MQINPIKIGRLSTALVAHFLAVLRIESPSGFDAAAVVAKVSKAKSPAKVVATPEKKKLSRTKTMAHTLKESKKILGDRRKMKKNRAVTPKAKRIAKKTAAKKPKAK